MKVFQILLIFSSNSILISTVARTQSSVVAFIPSPALSACCLLNLSSQGDHLDFSRFFLHCVSSKPYYIWHLSCPYIQKIDFAISLPFDLSWVSHCPTLILLCQGKCFIHKELFQTKHYLQAAIKILFLISNFCCLLSSNLSHVSRSHSTVSLKWFYFQRVVANKELQV